MLKSMYSGISGMKANQTKMDVVGNNVANVGTTAFKKSTTRFSDALNQTVIYSSVPGGAAGDPNVIGGVNPGQVGIGTKVSGIFRNMAQGAIQPTGRPTDLAIDGDGFFRVMRSDGSYAYTRNGEFNLDSTGKLVDDKGNILDIQPLNGNGK
ncbi:flagellar hook-basal body complex protein, partial [Parabacteroides merdae]|nr:flagellar hook-basal body complex protein [Parabacteroides merdae]